MKDAATEVYVGLGSNLSEPQWQVLRAFDELDRIPDTALLRRSSLYASAPLGPAGQPDYVNAVAKLRTRLEPHALLDQLQAIEAAHDRVREIHWGPRTLDLDLLLFGDQTVDSERLKVPHPHMLQRAFVLVPLSDMVPDLDLPGVGSLASYLDNVDRHTVRRLPDPQAS